MQLRIYRTYSWQLAIPFSQTVIGGSNPMELVAHDQLQYTENYGSVNVQWKPVPIVEAEKPEHPNDKRQREHFEKMQRNFKEISKDIKLPPPFDLLTKVGNKLT